MKGKNPVNVGASVRARLLKVSKERHEDFTLMLMNYAAERFLYRLSRSNRRDQFVLKGAMLFAVRIGETYRPTRDLDLLGTGDATEAAVEAAVREIATSDSATPSRRQRSPWSSRHSCMTCRARTCWPIRSRLSSRRRSKPWSISAC
jgi:hypothetical protein